MRVVTDVPNSRLVASRFTSILEALENIPQGLMKLRTYVKTVVLHPRNSIAKHHCIYMGEKNKSVTNSVDLVALSLFVCLR